MPWTKDTLKEAEVGLNKAIFDYASQVSAGVADPEGLAWRVHRILHQLAYDAAFRVPAPATAENMGIDLELIGRTK